MPIEIRAMQPMDVLSWDAYVSGHRRATPYHLSGWRPVIEETYGHQSHFLLARQNQQIVGVLPMVHMKHALSGNSMISMPFLDMAGVLADNESVAIGLIHEALNVMHRVEADSVELRQGDEFSDEQRSPENMPTALSRCRASGSNTRMVLDLQGGAETLLQSFSPSLRQQVQDSVKEGYEVRIAGGDCLEDFYHLFALNMRNLGTPVHSKEFLQNILAQFPAQTRIFVVYDGEQPVAGSLSFSFMKTAYIPLASSLRKHQHGSADLLLYWSMLEYACAHGCLCFDFGRTGERAPAYRFLQQWGGRPVRQSWYSFPNLAMHRSNSSAVVYKPGLQVAALFWKRVPLPISLKFGPSIRKHMGF